MTPLRIELGKIKNPNDYDELARMFLPRGEYELAYEQADTFCGVEAKLEKARAMYALLSERTGRALPWGVLTGVKPVKLYAALADAAGNGELETVNAGKGIGNGGARDGNAGFDAACDAADAAMRERYLVSDAKVALLRRVYGCQRRALPPPPEKSVSLYIGIPFCPTRCAYCAFPGEVGSERDMARYLDALYKEIGFVSQGMRGRGFSAESVYVGGGTPTALTNAMLEDLLARVNESVPMLPGAEFTVEAGRPDTISYLKALTMAGEGATRVSVNPQTLHERTLSAIGRRHLASDYAEAVGNVRAAGIPIVNTDIIAGLPGEGEAEFAATLRGVLGQGTPPENVTVHTLSAKRGSRLIEEDPLYCYAGGAAGMLGHAEAALAEAGYTPYYLYRQKLTLDNLENVGYAKSGAECRYNMRIMQERQTVIALGAGGSSKLYFPEQDRIERVFNVSDAGTYVERVGEMMERKRRIFAE